MNENRTDSLQDGVSSVLLAATVVWLLLGSSGGCREFAESKPRAFEVDPPSLSFEGRAGGLDPPSQNVTISEVDVRPVHWTASVDAPWIRLSSGGDTLPYFLGVSVKTAGLGVGTYLGTILVQRTEGGREARAIPVTLGLQTAVSLSGRWVGMAGTVAVSLNVWEQGGNVSGRGSLGTPSRIVAVVGTYTPPNISLSLVGADGATTRLTGSIADDNTIAAVLNGSALTNARATLYRQ